MPFDFERVIQATVDAVLEKGKSGSQSAKDSGKKSKRGLTAPRALLLGAGAVTAGRLVVGSRGRDMLEDLQERLVEYEQRHFGDDSNGGPDDEEPEAEEDKDFDDEEPEAEEDEDFDDEEPEAEEDEDFDEEEPEAEEDDDLVDEEEPEEEPEAESDEDFDDEEPQDEEPEAESDEDFADEEDEEEEPKPRRRRVRSGSGGRRARATR